MDGDGRPEAVERDDGAAPGTFGRAALLVRAGAVLFLVGLVAAVAAIVPYFFGARNLPTFLNAIAGGGMSLGLAVALVGLVAEARVPVPGEDDPDLYVNNPHGDGPDVPRGEVRP